MRAHAAISSRAASRDTSSTCRTRTFAALVQSAIFDKGNKATHVCRTRACDEKLGEVDRRFRRSFGLDMLGSCGHLVGR